MESDVRDRRGKGALLAGMVALLTALTLLSASNTYVTNSAGIFTANRVPWRIALYWGFTQWFLWVPVIPLAMRLPRWVPLKASLLRPAIAISATAILAAAFHTSLLFLIAKRAKWFLDYVMITDFLEGLLVFVAALAAFYAWKYYHEAQRGKLQSARLESQLAKANLSALRMQLNPHFLFNTLNTISSLQMSDPAAAQKMTAQLGDFFRNTLRSCGDQEVPLAKEMEFARTYLEIERIRFGDRLIVTCNVDPRLNELMVPNLILQPLLENAFRHGVSKVVYDAQVKISASLNSGELILTVKDNGPGCPEDSICEGIGISNTRERLVQLYGGRADFHVGNAKEGGFLAALKIPCRLESIESPQPAFAHAR